MGWYSVLGEMNCYVGLTDYDWFTFLSSRRDLDEVNFWRPGGKQALRALRPGEPFLFKLHSPRNFVVGGGLFGHFSFLPTSLAWDAFGEKNGAPSLLEMRARIEKYRRAAPDARADYAIGCILLEGAFFFNEADWIPAPPDWHPQLQTGKTYDTTVGEGRLLWERVELLLRARPARPSLANQVAEPPVEAQREQVRLAVAEALHLRQRYVDAALLQVAADVLPEVRELERRAGSIR